jgi:hypothetical protein
MTNKINKIDEGRIKGICKDIKKIRTLEGLKRFLTTEIKFIEEVRDERRFI